MDQDKSQVEVRVTIQQKNLFISAAVISGISLPDFMKSALLEKSSRTLHEHKVIILFRRSEATGRIQMNSPKTPPAFKNSAQWRKNL